MADLLTHILVAYIILTVASWRIQNLTERWIVIGMAGAAIPDLVKIDIVLDDGLIESLLGIPFSWGPISTLAGVLIIAAGITVLFEQEYRQVYAFLVSGGLLSLVVDGLRVFADGRSNFWLYPVWWRPPTPSLYVTSDPTVLFSALLVSAAVFGFDRFIVESPTWS